MRVSRDRTGKALQRHLAEWTGRDVGYVQAKPGSVFPYLVVIPLPGEMGESRTHEQSSGADMRFQVDGIGSTDDQAGGVLDEALAALTDRLDGVYVNAWTESTPAPCERRVQTFGPVGKNNDAGLRSVSADVALVVLG